MAHIPTYEEIQAMTMPQLTAAYNAILPEGAKKIKGFHDRKKGVIKLTDTIARIKRMKEDATIWPVVAPAEGSDMNVSGEPATPRVKNFVEQMQEQAKAILSGELVQPEIPDSDETPFKMHDYPVAGETPTRECLPPSHVEPIVTAAAERIARGTPNKAAKAPSLGKHEFIALMFHLVAQGWSNEKIWDVLSRKAPEHAEQWLAEWHAAL